MQWKSSFTFSVVLNLEDFVQVDLFPAVAPPAPIADPVSDVLHLCPLPTTGGLTMVIVAFHWVPPSWTAGRHSTCGCGDSARCGSRPPCGHTGSRPRTR